MENPVETSMNNNDVFSEKNGEKNFDSNRAKTDTDQNRDVAEETEHTASPFVTTGAEPCLKKAISECKESGMNTDVANSQSQNVSTSEKEQEENADNESAKESDDPEQCNDNGLKDTENQNINKNYTGEDVQRAQTTNKGNPLLADTYKFLKKSFLLF